MRKTLLSLFFLSFVFVSKAQQNLPAFNYVPQAPTTAAFTRYGDIPVDLSTGVTAVSIPIYTISENGINVPISISYHASGIKVNDISSTVGLGWTLNAGGALTRTVLGAADERLDIGNTTRPPWNTSSEFLNYFYQQEAQSREIWYDLLHNMMGSSYWDFYSDRFYFNLGNGESGVFRRDFATGVFKCIPYRPINIRFILSSGNRPKIEMVNVDGTKYLFANNEYDFWHVEKIVNSSNTDSVIFYSHFESIKTMEYSDMQEFGAYRNTAIERTEPLVEHGGPDMSVCLDFIREWDAPTTSNISHKAMGRWDDIVVIDSIVGTNTVVRFNYNRDRQDTDGEPGYLPHSRLTNIQVISPVSGALVKNINFSQGYSTDEISSTPMQYWSRLMLKGIQTGTNGEEKYEFKYHNPRNFPAYAGPAPSFGQDLWGYVGRPGNTLLFSDFAPYGSNTVFPHEEQARTGMLEEVKYPTGGKTVFEYESNRVGRGFYGLSMTASEIPEDGKVGGLRIKKISNYAYEGATPKVKSYEYECNLDPSYGILEYYKFAFNQRTFNYLWAGDNSCGFYRAQSTCYSRKNLCFSTPMGRYIGGPQAPVFYTTVTEYNGLPENNAGKTIYYYRRADNLSHDELSEDEPRFQGPWHTDVGAYTPELDKKEEYKFENGQYKLIRKTETTYTGIGYGDFITGFNLASDLEYITLSADQSVTAWDKFNLTQYSDFFQTLHYNHDIAKAYLELPWKTKVYDYVDNNTYILTNTEYSYNQNGQQTGVITTTSKGDIIKTKLTYPDNYPSQAPYNTMIERHILSPVIEQSTYKDISGSETFLQSMKTNYNYWDYVAQTWGTAVSNQILPQTVETKKGANDVETRIRYFSYDQKGNPVYVAKENDTRQLYLWDYNKTYPVAQVMNVSDGDKQYVVYNSFEAVTSWLPGWGTIVDDNTAPIGKKCLSLLEINSLQYALNSNNSYILSYWYKAGSSISIAANSSVLANPAAKNGWVFIKHKITGSSNVVISGNGYIDELRLYPETAQMTTFAYEPLVGITAQCDANDKVTYYTYDAAGRLSLVKDDNGNILKKICYNFQGQPDACGENAIPLWQTTGVKRCKPCSLNPIYFTNITQLEERDNNVNSETYGTLRWRDTGVITGPGACSLLGDWQLTGNLRCRTLNGQLTGEQEREWKDMNPCSSTAGNTNWEVFGTNTTACPVPAVFQSLDASGIYYSQNCPSPQNAKAYYVTMPPGSFTSSIDIQDATNKAKAEAQRLANLNGQCFTVYVKARLELTSDPSASQQFSNIRFYFYEDAAGTIPLALPGVVTVNYKIHEWATENDGPPFDEVYSDYAYGVSDVADITVSELESKFCPDNTSCYHKEVILQPGRYIIIP
jgi:uncharacterized protein DUF5977